LTLGAGFFEGGRAKLPSGCECTEELVDAEGTGEATGFEEATAGVFSVDDIFVSGNWRCCRENECPVARVLKDDQ
jgi:hypothetical protein